MTLSIDIADQSNEPQDPVDLTVAGTDGVEPYTYTVSSGTLPTGLSLVSNTGFISGTIDVAASTDNAVTIEVEDSDTIPRTATASFNWTIHHLTVAVPSDQYHDQDDTIATVNIQPSSGTSSFTYNLTGDALPSGLTLDDTTGDITGTVASNADTKHHRIAFEITDSSTPDPQKGFVEFFWSISKKTEIYEGSWYKLKVPDYAPDQQDSPSSYLRLGAPDVDEELNLNMINKMGTLDLEPAEDTVEPEDSRLYAGKASDGTKKTRPGWLEYTDGHRSDFTQGHRYSYVQGDWKQRIKGAEKKSSKGSYYKVVYGDFYKMALGVSNLNLSGAFFTSGISVGLTKSDFNFTAFPVKVATGIIDFSFSATGYKISKSIGTEIKSTSKSKDEAVGESIRFAVEQKVKAPKQPKKKIGWGTVGVGAAGLGIAATAMGASIAGYVGLATADHADDVHWAEKIPAGIGLTISQALWAAGSAYSLYKIARHRKAVIQRKLGIVKSDVASSINMDKDRILLRVGQTRLIIRKTGIQINAPVVEFHKAKKYYAAISPKGLHMLKGHVVVKSGSVYAGKSLETKKVVGSEGPFAQGPLVIPRNRPRPMRPIKKAPPVPTT